MRRTLIALAAAFVLGAGAGAVLLYHSRASANRMAATATPAWIEVEWPFPLDQWGMGKAYRCGAAACGAEVNVYVRAKIGFCNCTTGVSDDAELDRISDLELIGEQASALAAGKPITVAWMKGRSRVFALRPSGQSMISFGLNEHCDAIVATAVVRGAKPETVEPAVLALLASKPVIRWTKLTLGL